MDDFNQILPVLLNKVVYLEDYTRHHIKPKFKAIINEVGSNNITAAMIDKNGNPIGGESVYSVGNIIDISLNQSIGWTILVREIF